MLHLFNKVYLKHEHQYNKRRNCILLSSLYGYGTIKTFQDYMKDGAAYGTLLFAAPSYKELLSKNFDNNEQALVTELFEYDPSQRLVIYCNTNDFVFLTAKYFKTLLPNLTAESFYVLMKLTLSRMAYYFGSGSLTFVDLPATALADYESMKLLDKLDIDVLWDTTVPWELTPNQRDILISTCGVEFQLATYMVNKHLSHFTNTLEQKLVKMVKKEIIHDYVLDVKAGILMNPGLLRALEPSSEFELLSDTIENFVASHPEYKFLTDDNFTPENVDYIYNNYNMPALNIIREKVLKQTYRYYQKLTPFFNQSFTLDDILSYELSQVPTTTIIGDKGEYEEKINTYVVDYFLKLYNTSPLELTPYTLT